MAVFQVLINTKLYLSRKKEKRKKAYLYQPQVSKEIRREMREGITYSYAISRLNFVIYFYWWLLKCSKRWPGRKRKEQCGTMEGSEGLRANWRSEFSFWWCGNAPIFSPFFSQNLYWIVIYQKQIKNKRSALIKDAGSSLPTEGGIISRDNSLFYVRTSTPSATQPDWHCLNHKATPDRKKKQMSENVLEQSFQLAKCLHDSMNTDKHYQPI